MNKGVVLVGGGTIGTAIAYYVSKLGNAQVTLLDRDYIGSGNTAAAASLITLSRSKKAIIPLVRETISAVRDMEELLDEPSRVMKVGSVHVVASETSMQSINNLMEVADSFDLSTTWLSAEEVKVKRPWLNTGNVMGGAFMKDDTVCLDIRNILKTKTKTKTKTKLNLWKN